MDDRRPHQPTARPCGSSTAARGCSIDGEPQDAGGPGEYPDIYRQFVDLIDERRSQSTSRPLRLVADCLLAGTPARGVEPVPDVSA